METADRVVGWKDVHRETKALLEMHKDVVSGGYVYQWPAPGRKLCIDLQTQEDRSLKFSLDIIEGKRASSIAIGLAPCRKTTMQNRLADAPILRIDYTNEPDTMRHRNPDGGMVVGSHVHLDLDGTGIRWGVPLSGQTVIVGAEHMDVPELFWSFLDICHINKRLEVEQSLGV